MNRSPWFFQIALEELAERVNGDMRMALNQLQYMSLSMSVINYDDIRQRFLTNAKDEDISPFTAVDKYNIYIVNVLHFKLVIYVNSKFLIACLAYIVVSYIFILNIVVAYFPFNFSPPFKLLNLFIGIGPSVICLVLSDYSDI